MSIQSEIDRIAGAKPILGNYLQQNGVAVPSGATLDEMALLLADVIGTKSQEKIVNLSMASGNQVITPDDGYTLSKVTVTKPDTLIPDNIKKDVNIGGVVGSMSGGGAPSLQSKSVTYTANGAATIARDDVYDGLSSVDVTVNVSGGGSVETCTLTTSVDKVPGIVHGTIYAYSGDTLITITSKGTYSINKNSLIFVKSASAINQFTGLENLYSCYDNNENQNILVYNVTSDIATYNFTL